MKHYPLTRDIVFKAVFGRDTDNSKRTLMNLLNTILEPTGHEKIKQITLKNPFIMDNSIILKKPILDLKATVESGVQINIEIQVKNEPFFNSRMVYYLTKLHSEQLETGMPYDQLSKTINIQILSFCIQPKIERIHSWYRLKEVTTGETFSDIIELHCVQLPYLHDIIEPEDTDPLAKWLTLIRDIDKPEKQEFIKELCEQEEVMEMALQEYEKVTSNAYLKEQIDAIEKAEHDEASRVAYALARGIAEGKAEGEAKATLRFAQKLKLQGMDLAQIADLTELTIEQIVAL